MFSSERRNFGLKSSNKQSLKNFLSPSPVMTSRLRSGRYFFLQSRKRGAFLARSRIFKIQLSMNTFLVTLYISKKVYFTFFAYFLRVIEKKKPFSCEKRVQIESIFEQKFNKFWFILHECHLHQCGQLIRFELFLTREYIRFGYIVTIPL